MSTFPSVLSALTDPQPTDRLSSPSHSGIEQAQNDGIEKIEAFIGTLSSTAGTLMYDIRATASNGGGHVQTAVKGGTGQTTYTKGDVLAAQSSSVLAKLAVGLDGQVLAANSSVASGVNWANATSNRVAASVVGTSYGASTIVETSIMSVTLPGSVLGTGNAVRTSLYIGAFGTGTPTASVFLKMNYGSTAVGSILLKADGNGPSGRKGTIQYNLVAAGNVSAQVGRTLIDIRQDELNANSSSVLTGVHTYVSGSGSVVSSANQTIGVTARFSTSDPSNGITVDAFTVEKIV